MDGFMWGLIVGLFVGAPVGAGVICLCVIARRADDSIEANRPLKREELAEMDLSVGRR